MRLRTKYVVVLLIATVVLSAGVFGGLELYKDQLVGQTQREVDETAVLTADQIDTVVEDRKDFVGFVASRPAAARFDESGAYLDELVGNSRFFAAQIVAANGTIVDFDGDLTGTVQQEAVGSYVGDRSYVREALAGEVYVTDVEYVDATGNYVAIFSAPIFEDREIVGVLAAAIYVDRQGFFTMVGPVETGEQRVVVRDGNTTLYRGAGSFENAITSTATVEETGWTVEIARDRSALSAQLRDLALAQGLGLVLVLLSVMGFAAWEYRTTLGQTERLQRGFRALEAGDYDHTMSLAAAEEWREISDGFNELAAALSSRERELRRRRQRLEVLNRVLRHNLRNGASILIGYGERVRERADDPELVSAATVIVESAWRLTSLGDKARQVERAMHGGEEDPVATEVVVIVDDVLGRLAAEYPAVAMEASLPRAAWAYANPGIELAIENVVENACEHNDAADPRVDVTVTAAGRDGSTVEVRVADNGPGIPAQERRVLAEGRETPLEHGSGLGLWLAYWTVERSGGALRLDDGESGGTVVTLALDGVPPDERPDDGGTPRPDPGERGPRPTADAAEPGDEDRDRLSPLESLPYNRLRKMAVVHGIEVGATPTKDELVSALERAEPVEVSERPEDRDARRE